MRQLLLGVLDMRGETTPLQSVVTSFLRSGSWSPATRRWYAMYLTGFCDWLRVEGKEVVVGDIDPITVGAFIEERKRTSHATARGAGKTLKRFGSWLAEPLPGQPQGIWSVGGESVLRKVKVPRPSKPHRQPFKDDELPRILEAAGKSEHGSRDQAMVALMLGCGFRLGECRQLRPEHIDWKKMRIYVPAEITKGKRRDRIVRLDSDAARYLDRYVSDYRPDVDGPLFLTAEGKPFTDGGLGRVFYRLKERCGIKDFMAHRLRHTWATNFLRFGAGNLPELVDEGGWLGPDVPMKVYAKAMDIERRSRITPLAALMRRSA